MEELLDIVRREFKSANRYFSEEFGSYMEMSDDIVEEKFTRFQYLHSYLWQAQQGVKQNFIDIGRSLFELRCDEIYKAVCQEAHGGVGYGNFYKFCQDVFGFKKKTVQRLLKVFEEFGNKESGLLDVEYVNFSFRQLVELAGMDKYRERVPVTASTRDIKRLKELYKNYTPKPGQTVEDDLREWQTRHKAELDEKNYKKNSISFIPSKKSDEVELKIEGSARTPRGEEEVSESDSEDERLLSTPEVKCDLSFEQIRNGLLRQLELLSGVLGWNSAAATFMDALKQNLPARIARIKDVVKIISENEELKKKVAVNIPANGARLNLKNEKARREWLDNFRSWGVWRELPEVSKTFYRYDFINGYSIIVEVGVGYNNTYDCKGSVRECERVKYAFLDGKHAKYSSDGESYTYAIKWLTEFGKEI